MREDETRDTTWLLIQASCRASLVAVALALGVAKHETGGRRGVLITIGVLTVILSWTLVNSVFTLRYADLIMGPPARPSTSATLRRTASPITATSPIWRSPSE
jgi:uncharacterized membrane protein